MIVGEKIRFAEERRSYTVRAANDRFAICTKPLNLHHTVLYTIVDFDERVRGAENLIFGFGFATDEQCQQALERLANGETAVSHRNRVCLNIIPIPAGSPAPKE